MSEWITVEGAPQQNSSNLANTETKIEPRIEQSAHMEVRSHGDGTASFIDQSGREYVSKPDSEYRGSVLATATTEGGGIIVGRSVRATDQVMLPEGIPASVAVAAMLGYLQRNPDGSFSDTDKARSGATMDTAREAEAKRAEAEAEAAKEAEFHIGNDGEAAMTAITQSVQPGDAIKAMDEVLQRGEVSENTLARMASQAGIEPEQMREQINAAHQGFYDAAAARLEAAGIADEDAFAAFVQDNPQVYQKLLEGARALVMSNSTTEIDAVKDAFLEQADRYMTDEVKDALEEAGYGWKPKPGGGLLVVLAGGQEVPFNVAVKQRIITFSQ
ncbi:hypothetical protein FGK63_05230 [Ruegeria sediminis]|uniref:Uncharacterized protein n=1 Tax=Ruegeria sediminis TaxID=2583820 RepID=A0ABY2WZW0_9RHOB|nr:hypothetical protein [Ruegeria sediminis]TMV08531.1 hypothetical protein FGK63_05230 [Ruegeria sediminis]